jgi:hypothetical protein
MVKTFPVAPELAHEYVVATIDVKEQKLKLSWIKPRLMRSITSYIKRMSVHDVLARKSIHDVVALNN